MANHKSAQKKARQDIVRRTRNRSGRSTLRTALRKFRSAADAGTDMSSSINDLLSLIDRSAKRGLIHRNAADRLKSRVVKRVNASS